MDKKEKDVKQPKKEKVKKTEKQNKVNLDNKKKLIILISAIILIAIIGITIFFVLRNDDEYKLANVKPTISTLEDGTYYIFGSPNNQSFEVETKENFTYKVVDEKNNEVKVSTTKKDNKVVINAPEKFYEDGKTYTLTITNGTFTEEDLKEASVVSFSIVRKSKQTQELNKNVKSISSETNKVNEIEGKITLTSEEEYKKGDIILIDNKNAYKVENVEEGTYQLSIPTLEEVYKELDYYGVQILDLTNFETDENFKEYLEDNIEKNLLNKIIPEVDAASKIELELKYDKKKEELIAIVKIATSPGDKLFKSKFLDNHEFSTTIEIGIKMLLYRDITLYKQDVGLTLNLRTDLGFNVSHPMFREFKETFEKEFNDDKLIDVRNYVKDAKKDDIETEQKIGKMSVPTGIAGLNVIFNAGYLFDINLKTDLNASLGNTLDVVIGYSSKKGLYGNADTNPKATSSFLGEGEVKIGFQGEAGVSILNIIDLVGVIEVGGYNKGSLSIANTVSEESKSIITTTGEGGLFATVKAEADTPIGDLSYTVFDNKLKLIDINESIDAKTIVKAQDKPVSKEEDTTQKAETNNNNNNSNNNSSDNNITTTPTYKYTAAEVRQKIQEGYNALEYEGAGWNWGGGTIAVGFEYKETINVSSNILTTTWTYDYGATSYTCNYNYVKETMSCANYPNAKNYIKNICQNLYNEYLNYKSTGTTEYAEAMEWENEGYNNVDECVNHVISSEQPTNYKGDIIDILNKVGLSYSDLEVLK